LVVPRAVDAVVRNEVQLLTVQQLDESLRQAGLPVTKEIFAISYDKGPDEEVEPEVIGPEPR
jgi:hypothetical protein